MEPKGFKRRVLYLYLRDLQACSEDKIFTTVLMGDCMIRQIQGRKFGRNIGHRVVVKSFSGATTTI